MKRTGEKLFVIAFAAGFSILVLTSAGQDSEPVFDGKTLSTWLKQYRSTSISAGDADKMSQNERAIKAVRSIGTNAIPTLLRMIGAKNSKYGLSELNVEGVDGFFILGAAASNAVPELVEIFEKNKFAASRASAAHALAGIGSGAAVAIPDLLRQATNSEPTAVAFAFLALAKIPASFDLVIPIATQALNGTNFLVKYDAMEVLQNCGSRAKESVPALVEMSTNSDAKLRRSACVTLGKIHSLPDVTIPALTARLSDPVAGVRGEAAWDLGNFGTLAKRAIPALLELQNDKDLQVRSVAEEALRRINLERN